MKTESDISKSRGDTSYPKTPKSDSAPDWNLFGETPRYIAAGLRIRPELALAYMTSVLGGLAGAFARLDGFLGERHHPALPLVLADRHPSKARSLCRLATGPVLHYSDWERRKLQALSPELFELHHSQRGAAIRQSNLRLLEALGQTFSDEDAIAAERSDLLRHRQNYQPSVMLSSPEPGTFDALRGSVVDEHPLIVDTGGRLIRNAIQPHPKQKEWQALLERITEGARDGIDLCAGEGSPETLSKVRRFRSPFLIHLPHELVGHTLLHPVAANLFEVGVLLPTEGIDGSLVWSDKNFEIARKVVGKYRDALNKVLWARRDNSGVAYTATRPIPELIEGQDKLHDRIDCLPSEVRRFCGGLTDLPLRLLWTALLLDDRKGKQVEQSVPGVLQTARWCVERHIEMVTDTLEAVRRRELEEGAIRMLRKLTEIPHLPCKFADLARKYHFQGGEVLEPILRFLCNEGLTFWDPAQNRIDLLECHAPPQWLVARKSATAGALTLPSRSPDAT